MAMDTQLLTETQQGSLRAALLRDEEILHVTRPVVSHTLGRRGAGLALTFGTVWTIMAAAAFFMSAGQGWAARALPCALGLAGVATIGAILHIRRRDLAQRYVITTRRVIIITPGKVEAQIKTFIINGNTISKIIPGQAGSGTILFTPQGMDDDEHGFMHIPDLDKACALIREIATRN